MPNIMSKPVVKSGIAGAVGLLLAGLLLIVVQEAVQFGSPPQKAANHVWLVIARPVLWAWESVGVRGAEDLRLVIPMAVSVLLYLAGLGFIGGVVLRRATRLL